MTSRPNEVWVADVTFIQTEHGWRYLAVIIDLYARAVVGWALAAACSTRLTLAALAMALRVRNPPRGLLHHSDRGSTYTSYAYQTAMHEAGFVVSMSRVANCWDNAVAESFFATIKTELVSTERWKTNGQLDRAVLDYIEEFYNQQRLHSTLDYCTPAEVEDTYNAGNAAQRCQRN